MTQDGFGVVFGGIEPRWIEPLSPLSPIAAAVAVSDDVIFIAEDSTMQLQLQEARRALQVRGFVRVLD